MENEIAVTGRGGYRIVIVNHGGTKPEQLEKNDATIESNDGVVPNGGGNWALVGEVRGGKDLYAFDGDIHANSEVDAGATAEVSEGDAERITNGSGGGWGPVQPPTDPDAERYGTAGRTPERDGGDPAVEYPNGVGHPGSFTTAPMYRWIDPDDGDDSWPGTKSDPIASISEFVSRLPTWGLHGIQGVLAKGTYEEGAIHWPHPVFLGMGSGKGFGREFGLGGAGGKGPAGSDPSPLPRADREDIVVRARQINAQLYPYGNVFGASFHNFELKGCIQNRWGTTTVANVTLDPGANPQGSRPPRGVDTYGGRVFVWDSRVRDGADYLANTAQHGMVSLRRCDGTDADSLKAAVRAQATDPSLIFDVWGNEFPHCPFVES